MIRPLGNAQGASASDTTDYLDILHRGIYLTADDFVNNTPIRLFQLETNLDSLEINFYYLLFKESKVKYRANNQLASVAPSRVWGYFDGNAVYVNKNLFREHYDVPDKILKYSFGLVGEMDLSNYMFTNINFLGTICFIHYLQIQGKNSVSLSGPTTRQQKYIFDTRSRTFAMANLKSLKEFIKDDEVIMEEFKNTKGNKEIKFHLLLKKYNERHPFGKK
jgi:hypothetical protein